MFKDINLSIDNDKVDFKQVIKNGKIIIKTINELKVNSILRIFYDENIYEIKLNKNTKFVSGKSGEIFIYLDSNKLVFSVILKDNYFVKSVYKYINRLINKDILIEELNLFLNDKVGYKHIEDVTSLLSSIKNKEYVMPDDKDEYKRIFKLLVNNKTYINIAENMNDLALMLLITSYIFVPYVPKIDQDSFNDLVNVAKTYDNALENIWRLGMNFDCKGYDFSLLEDFFVNSKNIRYLGEYISGVHQANQDSIINKIINNTDKAFIKQVLKDDYILKLIDEKNKNILEKNI